MPVRLGWSQVHLCQWETCDSGAWLPARQGMTYVVRVVSYGIRIRSCLLLRAGRLPPELGRLTRLTWLDLHSNALSGESVPAFVQPPWSADALALASVDGVRRTDFPSKGPEPISLPLNRLNHGLPVERANAASYKPFLFVGRHDFWVGAYRALYLKPMSCYGE